MERADNGGAVDGPPDIHSYLLPITIVVAGVTVLAFGLGSLSLRSHEIYVAVPVREMFATGDFIVPRYGGTPRLEKPPLAYWSAALSTWVCGRLTEWTVRLPSFIAAIGLAFVIRLWARRWYGAIAGWGAFAVQVSSVYAVLYARRAEIDIQLCLLTTSTLFLISADFTESSTHREFRWFIIYGLLTLSWLAKFHYGP
ncbi:MAG: ArnT family glycosyltransferase, partial [Planctomycetaceae bacterium]